MKFEWNPDKAISNFTKHSVTFSEAATIFGDPLEVTIADPDHSVEEFRFLSIGRSEAGRLLVVAYTERNNHIRIITARQATPQEVRNYETESTH